MSSGHRVNKRALGGILVRCCPNALNLVVLIQRGRGNLLSSPMNQMSLSHSRGPHQKDRQSGHGCRHEHGALQSAAYAMNWPSGFGILDWLVFRLRDLRAFIGEETPSVIEAFKMLRPELFSLTHESWTKKG
jgi:hypothetical protein